MVLYSRSSIKMAMHLYKNKRRILIFLTAVAVVLSIAQDALAQPITHKVKKGENLSVISQIYYDAQCKWPVIFDANKNRSGKNRIHHPKWIYPGQELIIPEITENGPRVSPLPYVRPFYEEIKKFIRPSTGIITEEPLNINDADINREPTVTPSRQTVSYRSKYDFVYPAPELPVKATNKKEGWTFFNYVPLSVTYQAGNLSAFEEENIHSRFNAEVRADLIFRSRNHFLGPFAGIFVNHDSQRFYWNNRTTSRVGLKYAFTSDRGGFSIGTGRAITEPRVSAEKDRWQSFAVATYWLDWQRRNLQSKEIFLFPGYSHGSIGNTEPMEPDNILGQAYIAQGARLYQFRDAAIVSFAEIGVTVDSDKIRRNNELYFGPGLKLIIPLLNSTTESGLVYRYQHRWLSPSQTANGPTVFVNFKVGWNPPQ